MLVAREVWLAPDQENGPGGPGEEGSKRKGNGAPAPSSILIVEDDVLIRLAVADFLRECGYRVLEAAHGEEAQVILRSSEIVELLFTDINLGAGLSGFELAKWTRHHFPGVRIIVTSGISEMVELAASVCDRPLIPKPYSYSSLADEIRQLLGTLGRRTK